jgi:hypothetical protein
VKEKYQTTSNHLPLHPNSLVLTERGTLLRAIRPQALDCGATRMAMTSSAIHKVCQTRGNFAAYVT